MISHFVLSQELFFLKDKMIIFPVAQVVLPVRGFVPPLAISIHPKGTGNKRMKKIIIVFYENYIFPSPVNSKKTLQCCCQG